MTKTNVIRQLEKAGIPFRTAEYEVDEADLSGVHVARQLGQPCEQVFKTLVLQSLAPLSAVSRLRRKWILKRRLRQRGRKRQRCFR